MGNDDTPTTLYRFYGNGGALLYIGITLNPGERWKRHRDDKPWWTEVTNITLEQHPTRQAALEAERLAIVAERPAHNIVHNRTPKAGHRRVSRASTDAGSSRWHDPHLQPLSDYSLGPWRYGNHATGGPMPAGPMHLTYELHLDPVLAHLPDRTDGEDQLRYWLREYDRHHLGYDEVRVSWFVEAPHGLEVPPGIAVSEYQRIDRDEQWEDVFTHCYSDRYGYLDWFALDVRHDRFPAFGAALERRGLTPHPFADEINLNVLDRSVRR